MSALSGSVSITWTDPTVSGSQLALQQLLIFENDLVAQTQTQVGAVAPGVEEWTSGYVLPPGAERTYQVQAIDIGGNAGPQSTASNEIEVSPTPTPTLPGAPSAPVAALNP